MTVINDFAVVPSRVRAVVRYLSGRGATTRDDLLRALGPETLSESGKSEVRAALNEGQRLGLFEESDEKWHLTSPLHNDDDLVRALDRSIVAARSDDSTEPNDPAAAIAWFLTRDPFRPLEVGENWLTIVDAECPGGSEVFGLTNPDRSRQFAHWATYLGFAWRLPGRLVIDPTVALERHLRDAMAVGQSLQVEVVLELLADRSPVFEGGSVRSAVESRLVAERARPSSRLSRSTSFALRRLEQQGVLSLPPPPSDAAVLALDLPQRVRNVSHVELLEGS